MSPNRRKSCLKLSISLLASLAGLCLVLAAISALINATTAQPPASDRLTGADKARLAEVIHLRQALGESILPGFSRADIPLILYNERYVFLVGYSNPPAGWEKVPFGPRRGAAWEAVPEDTFQGKPYYRQPLPGPGQQPENFTVRVGERWAASLMTLDWFKSELARQLREGLPAPLRPIFPYSLAANLTMSSSDQYMTSILHEAAHAYQGMQAPGKLAAAETNVSDLKERYPWEDQSFSADWQAELDVLRDGVQAKTDADARALAARFLDLRAARRKAAGLAPDLVHFERLREWEEGFAKYTELSAYRLAATTPGYTPIPELKSDPQFRGYRGFSQRWQNEANQISLSGRQPGEIRFYYSGWAQSVLLDRLSPGWKARLFEENAWMEDLLSEALR